MNTNAEEKKTVVIDDGANHQDGPTWGEGKFGHGAWGSLADEPIEPGTAKRAEKTEDAR